MKDQDPLGVPTEDGGRPPSPVASLRPSDQGVRSASRALARRRKKSEEIDASLQFDWGDGSAMGDDFTVTTPDGYMLRVEQMDRKAWWWQVYYPDGSQADPWCDLTVPSEYIAKRLCEIIYRLHSRATGQSGAEGGSSERSDESGTRVARDGAAGAPKERPQPGPTPVSQ